MHDDRSLKYRIKVVGERVGKNREIKEGEPVKDHSGNICDLKVNCLKIIWAENYTGLK